MTIWLGIVYAYKGLLMVGAEQEAEQGTYFAASAPSPRDLINTETNRAPGTQTYSMPGLVSATFPQFS